MRISVFILFLLLGFSGKAQNRKFLIHYIRQNGKMYELHEVNAQRLDLHSLAKEEVSGNVIAGINAFLARKLRKPLVQDSILNKICFSGVETFSTSRFRNRKTWRKEQKNLDYALKLDQSKNRLFVAYAFRVSLLDLDVKEKFYCDKRVGESEIDLYRGNKPKFGNPKHEDYVEPVPLSPMTNEQMLNEVLKKLNQNGCLKNIFSRKFSQIGIAVRMEKRSLSRSKRPYMYVMLMLAGKQNQYMKKKDRLERLVKMDGSYE
jgi:hypothetical protein